MDDYYNAAKEAAHAAGGLMRAHFEEFLNVDSHEAHDVKLELDRKAQSLIEGLILSRFPDHAIYGEEGVRGDQSSEFQWIVDPIDGTVNYFFGIPHFAVSIALRQAGKVIVGVIYDPMRDELWGAKLGGPATLNGHLIQVSQRTQIGECAISIGVSKTLDALNESLPVFQGMIRRAKKCRMMGSAALDIAYVACGRLDAYIEGQINLWDIAAGLILVDCAGGVVDLVPHKSVPDKFSIVATSGNVDLGL